MPKVLTLLRDRQQHLPVQCSRLIGLTVEFGSHRILDNITLQISSGELTALIGPNGAGKSTLLKCILGEVSHLGELKFLDANNNPLPRPRIGYVPQKLSFDTESPVSVLDLFVASSTRYPAWLPLTRAVRHQVEASLSMVGVERLIDQRLGSLSGGELQRVLLALALTPLPDLLLLDEPVSGVDQNGMELFYQTLAELKRKQLAILLVSHDLDPVARIADQIILLNRRVILAGTPEKVLDDQRFLEVFGTRWRHAPPVQAIG